MTLQAGRPAAIAVEELLAEVRRQLRAASNDRDRQALARFFKEPVHLLGVRSPAQKRIAAHAARQMRDWTTAGRNRFATGLWKSGVAEEAGIAIYAWGRFAHACGRCEFKLFERWIDRYVTNWGACDGVSIVLVAASLANEPELASELPAWTASPNRWKRRASAVSLVPAARRGRQTPAIFDVARRLIGDPDEMVQKGVGWLLKETYPKEPREVVAFLRPHRDRASRLLLRYAAEKMTPRDRARVLE